jgi:hypothetical protein
LCNWENEDIRGKISKYVEMPPAKNEIQESGERRLSLFALRFLPNEKSPQYKKNAEPMARHWLFE